MLSVKLDTGFNIEVAFAISPFSRRLFAWVLDTALMGIYWWILLGYFGVTLEAHPVLLTLAGLPPLLYYPAMEILTNGQTAGKRVLGIRVISLDGGQASVSQYLLRWLLGLVDMPYWVYTFIYASILPWYCSILCFSGLACMFISGKMQRIGDVVAGTIVIYTRERKSWQDTVFTELEEGYQPKYPEVMRISDKDMNSLKTIIEMSKKKKDEQMALRIANRITSKLDIHTKELPLDFLETLLKDYNYYTSK